MTGDIEVQNPAAAVFDNEEAVKQAEGNRGYREEVKRNSHFTMILQKGEPLLSRVAAPAHSSKVSSHRSFGYDEAQFLNFALNPRSSPNRVLCRHPLNEISQLLIDPRPTTPGTRTPPPVEMKTGTVPANYGFWFDDDEDIAPAGPEAPKSRPEESVEGMQGWPGPFSFEDSDLLAQGEDLQGGVGSAAKKDADHGEEGENAVRHEITLVT